MTVSDSGPGIPPDLQARVFERFYRADTSRSAPGSGLGLSLVRAVAQLHGATIRLANTEPGLQVTLSIPTRGPGRMMAWMTLPTVLLAVALAGCADLPYYWQAAGGQFELWQRSRPIAELVADQTTEADIKARLERVQAIRAFASRELGLPDNASYRTYADLGRPFVVWNLFAAPELSLTPKEWCFPVAGCVTYRGYFAEAGARALAGELEAQGLDTYVGGVPAYSTLGWFADPLPSTVIGYPDLDLARLIFHELAHQVVYVPGDTLFNESFATTVEREGVRRWAEAKGTPADLNRLAQCGGAHRRLHGIGPGGQGQVGAGLCRPRGCADQARGQDPHHRRTALGLCTDQGGLGRGRAPGCLVCGSPEQCPDRLSCGLYAAGAGLQRPAAAVGRGPAALLCRGRRLARLPKPERDDRLAVLGDGEP